MKYAFDTNIYQIWRNINDPALQKISNHPAVQTIKKCFLDVEAVYSPETFDFIYPSSPHEKTK